MKKELMNSKVLITGASSGIGLACVEAFAKAGYQVVATAEDVVGNWAEIRIR